MSDDQQLTNICLYDFSRKYEQAVTFLIVFNDSVVEKACVFLYIFLK